MNNSYFLLLLVFLVGCGTDEKSGFYNNQCEASLFFKSKTQLNGFEELSYTSDLSKDCHNFFFNSSGEWSYRLEINAKASQGYLRSFYLDSERTIEFLNNDDVNSFNMGRVVISKEIKYMQPDNKKWLLPIVPAPTNLIVKVLLPEGVDVDFYPNIVKFSAEKM